MTTPRHLEKFYVISCDVTETDFVSNYRMKVAVTLYGGKKNKENPRRVLLILYLKLKLIEKKKISSRLMSMYNRFSNFSLRVKEIDLM